MTEPRSATSSCAAEPLPRAVPVRRCEVAIIGAGPSGLSAAMELKRLGVSSVLVLEREAQAGGVPRHCGHPPFGVVEFRRVMKGPAYARRLADAARHAGVEILSRASVTALHPGGVLSVDTPEGPLRVDAARVLLATGVRETPRSARLVGGVRALGVLNTGALQAMVYLENLVPFRRPLVVGTELVSFSALYTCRRAGIRPVAMVEENPRPTVPWPLHHAARIFGVPLHLSTRIEAIEGSGRVRAALVSWPGGSPREISCDGVLFTGRFTPESSLARLGHLRVDAGSGGPEVDQLGRCSDPAYYAAGNLLRPVEPSWRCWGEGRVIASAIAADLQANGETPPPRAGARIHVAAPLRYAMPQVLSPEGGPGLGAIQLRLSRPASGRLCLYRGQSLLWSRSLRALPEQRILVPLAPLLAAPGGEDFLIRLM